MDAPDPGKSPLCDCTEVCKYPPQPAADEPKKVRGVGHVIVLGVLLGLTTAALGLWWVAERIKNEIAP